MALGLQEKEEVEQYLQNIGIEYRFQCYSEKRPDGCHRLGDFMESVKKDFSKAAAVYQLNCDTHSYPHSCFKFGNYKLLGRGCDPDGETAMQYYLKSCEKGFSVACYQAALLRWTGQYGARVDKAQARSLFDQGCSGNDSESCYYLSTTYISDDPKGNEGSPGSVENEKKAFEYSRKACNLNHMYACANLHQMYKRGMGCQKDEVLADAAKRKAVALRDSYSRNDPGVVFGEGGN